MQLSWLGIVPWRGLVASWGTLRDCGFGPLGPCLGCMWWGGRQPVDVFLSHRCFFPSFSLSKSKFLIFQKRITHIFLVVKVNLYQFGSKFIWKVVCLLFERREGREKERERHSDVRKKHQLTAFHMNPDWHPHRNPGIYPDQKLNRWPFGLLGDTQPTEPHWTGEKLISCCVVRYYYVYILILYVTNFLKNILFIYF